MRIYNGRKGEEKGASLREGAFVCASAVKEAAMMGDRVDSYDVDPAKMQGVRMLRVNVPELFQDYIEGERADADIVMYPYMSQCSKPEFLLAFLTEKSLEALVPVEE